VGHLTHEMLTQEIKIRFLMDKELMLELILPQNKIVIISSALHKTLLSQQRTLLLNLKQEILDKISYPMNITKSNLIQRILRFIGK